MKRIVSFVLAVFSAALAATGCTATQGEGPSSSSASTATVASAATIGAACTSNTDCDPLEYCAPSNGQCGAAGTCVSRGATRFCMQTVDVVCGCDGQTYRNGCFAAKAGAPIASAGACASPPAPFALQYVGTYDVTQPSATGMATLTIQRDGSYDAEFNDGSSETGTFTSYDAPTIAYALQLTSGTNWWTATITSNGGAMTLAIDSATDTATPDGVVGPDETTCDSSGGAWSDDDSLHNGLFCSCPAGQAYIPNLGGCVQ